MKKIFIIEDDNMLRENLVSLFEVENFKVFSSGNGKKGIELIKEVKPDFILCDVMLPDIDGYQIVKEIKSNDETRQTPFVFLTAKTDMKDLRNGMNLGADDYLTKPYDATELIHVVNTRIELNKPVKNEHEHTEDEPAGNISMGDFIFVQSSKQVKKIPVKEIVCIFASAEYSEVFTENSGKVLARKLMKSWEEILPSKNFIRIHKSIMINLSYLQKIEKWLNSSYKIYLFNYPEPLISSRRYSSKLRSKMLN